MQWIELRDIETVNNIKKSKGFSAIFKHSTRCAVSAMAKRNFERSWDAIPEGTSLYFLDLITHRDVSNYIAEIFQVHHESPQLLLIKDGECVLDASHSDISAEEIAEVIG